MARHKTVRKCPGCGKPYKSKRGFDRHVARCDAAADAAQAAAEPVEPAENPTPPPVEADSARPSARPPAEDAPSKTLTWTANGATWTAASPKVPGRIYTVRPAPVSGCVATYTGQRGSCRFAGRRFPNTDAARIACAEIERDLEA